MSGYLGVDRVRLPGGDGGVGRHEGHRPQGGVGQGDGGFGQYLAEVTTAVRHKMPITHVLLNNSEGRAKISRSRWEPCGRCGRPTWSTPTSPSTPGCAAPRAGGSPEPDQLRPALEEAMAVTDGPALVEVIGTLARDV